MKRRKLRLPVRPDGHYEVLCFPSFNQVEANICLRLWKLSSTTVIDRRHLELRRMAQGCYANTHPLASLFLIGSIVDHRAMRRCFCAPAPPAALDSDLENTRELTFGPGLGLFRSTSLNVTGNSSRSHSYKTEKCNQKKIKRCVCGSDQYTGWKCGRLD